jgi:hypothetical protein
MVSVELGTYDFTEYRILEFVSLMKSIYWISNSGLCLSQRQCSSCHVAIHDRISLACVFSYVLFLFSFPQQM